MATPKNPALKSFRPITPALRFTQLPRFDELTTDTPEKSLTKVSKRSGGRNAHGRITSRRRGGGHKRKYRVIDFKRNKTGVRATVQTIEYDPFRTARIALVKYADDELRYIIAPRGLKVGDTIENGPHALPNVGNNLPLSNIPLGTDIHNIELTPGRGGQLVRVAGASAVIQSSDGDYAQVRLPSGEVRKVHLKCSATVGEIGNQEHKDVKLGKAGRTRWMGKRPRVRGMVMNPVDHPNGGGEAKSKSGGGRQHPVSPWGQLSRGFKTRQKHKPSSKFIVQRRKSKKRSR